MKVEIPEIQVIKGDIELTEEISNEQYDQICEVLDQTKNAPIITLVLTSKQGQTITISNLSGKYFPKGMRDGRL